jgi:c-di-GMP-binding flagellar brake protein YcgR
LLISWPQKTERIQRRDFFRIPCALDAQFMVITGQGFPPGDLSPEDLPLSETALAVNLSGGGLLLVSDSKLSVDSLLLLRLPLHARDEIKTVLLKGKVIRTASFRLGKVRRYRYGIKFLDLKEKDREEIISYIFSTMRERLY